MKPSLRLLLSAVLAVGLAGCAITPVLLPPATGAAACVVIQKKPAAAPYVRAVAGVFTLLGKREAPPTPDELSAALSQLPGGNFNQVYARAIWAGAVQAYGLIWKAAQSEETRASLGATLQGIGQSLALAAESCGPPPSPTTASRTLTAAGTRLLAGEAEAAQVAEAIARDLRHWQHPRH